jgi:hypothetical protein
MNKIEACGKKVPITMRDRGIVGHSICIEPVYKDGACKKHYNQRQRKLVPWGERDTYRDITLEEFMRGRTMKLKSEHVNNIYRYRHGLIQKENKQGVWVTTNLTLDTTEYCVKK